VDSAKSANRVHSSPPRLRNCIPFSSCSSNWQINSILRLTKMSLIKPLNFHVARINRASSRFPNLHNWMIYFSCAPIFTIRRKFYSRKMLSFLNVQSRVQNSPSILGHDVVCFQTRQKARTGIPIRKEKCSCFLRELRNVNGHWWS
jgi:hypothetical protein